MKILKENERELFQRCREILCEAKRNPQLLFELQERASIRWAEGLSDSLFDAVMCNIRPSGEGEKAKRDEAGRIILSPKTDWEAELASIQN